MKVWNFTTHSTPLLHKVIYTGDIFVTKLLACFKDKDYGIGVKEIFYREFFLHGEDEYDGKFSHYGKIRKIIVCDIFDDFDKVLRMTDDEFTENLARLYMERTKEFKSLPIKNFDVEAYTQDLEYFFKANGLIK